MMPKVKSYICAVAVCQSPQDESYHRFPKDPELRQIWVSSCKRTENFKVDYARICGRHFDPSCKERDFRNELLGLPTKNHLKKDSIPTRFLTDDYISPNEDEFLRDAKANVKIEIQEILNDENPYCGIPETMDTHTQYITKDAAIQCEMIKENSKLKLENEYLRRKLLAAEKDIMNLRTQNKFLKSKKHQIQILNTHIGNKLSPSMKKRIISTKTTKFQRGYTKDEMISSLVLRHMSSKTYQYLRKNNLLALPSRQTQERWLQEFDCSFGFQHDSIRALRDTLQASGECHKYAILAFDEMDIKRRYEIESKKQQMFGPCKKVQMVILRGLVTDWKQPVFFDLDTTMTKELLFSIIQQLEEEGFQICGVTLNIENASLISQLSLSEETTSFPNPNDPSRQVYAFPDACHLLKKARDHLLDKGFMIFSKDGSNSTVLDKSDFQKLLIRDESKVAHKLNDIHLNCLGSARKRVSYAAQLLSRTTAKAISFTSTPNEIQSAKLKEDFILAFDSWFDVLNSVRTHDDKKKMSCGLGIHWEEQLIALENMESLIKTMKVMSGDDGFQESYLPWQKGILMLTKSLKGLYHDLVMFGSLNHILTARLNRDCVENFFSRIRAILPCDNFSHLGPVGVLSRIKLLLIGKNYHFHIEDPHVQMEEVDVDRPCYSAQIKKDFKTEPIFESM